MKSINKSLEDVLESAISESLAAYETSNDGNFLADLYIYYNEEGYSITFYDDVEKELLSLNLDGRGIESLENAPKELKHAFKKVLKRQEQEKVFDKEFIYKPFTVNLVDEDFLIVEELIFIDDDTVQLDHDLWNNLDKELDDFFNDLMK